MKTERTVTQGIYTRIPLSNGQFQTTQVGQRTIHYTYETNDTDDIITINGNSYRVEYDREWAIKVMKTKIKAKGAKRLVELLTEYQHACSDTFEQAILETTKPIQL